MDHRVKKVRNGDSRNQSGRDRYYRPLDSGFRTVVDRNSINTEQIPLPREVSQRIIICGY